MSKFIDGTPVVAGALYVGPPGKRLYRQGTCFQCKISLWGWEPLIREVCGDGTCDITPYGLDNDLEDDCEGAELHTLGIDYN